PQVKAEIDQTLFLGLRLLPRKALAKIIGAEKGEHAGDAAERRRAGLGEEIRFRAAEAEVHVRIDKTRHDPPVAAIDFPRSLKPLARLAYRRDTPIAHAD